MASGRFLRALVVLLPLLWGQQVLAKTPILEEAVVGSGYGVVGASLARAEESMCRSMVNYSHVRGAFGEEVMDRVALGSRRGGGWQTISLSPKSQGIDGIYIKRDGIGNPRGLLVGEAKFGSSRLGMTMDGRQLSPTWIAPRLSYEASRYQHAGSSTSVEFRARPNGLAENPDVVKVRLPNERDGYFWRSSKFDSWAYDGPQDTLKAAQSAAVRDGRYLQAAAQGKISYRQRLFKIDVTRDTIIVKMQDAKPTGPDDVSLREIARVNIDAATRRSYLAVAKSEIARQLMIKNPHLQEEEAKTIAANATRKMKHLEAILRQQNRTYWLSALSDFGNAGAAGGVLAGAVDVAAQMYFREQVDWAQAGNMAFLGAGSASAGAMVHHLVVGAAVNNATAHQFFIRTANVVGLPTGMTAANIVGKGAGGAIGNIMFATGMYVFGNMKGDDATRMAGVGIIGLTAGMAAEGAIVLFATSYGTAGTGVAISSLSGAAANSAALAWLGGGTVASSGGGMALGSIVVTGGIAIVAVATTAVIYWGYAEYGNSIANHRLQYNANRLISNTAVLDELCRRQWFPDLGSTR